ncbi:hypothetical protein [Burkholderia phage FLC9]|nr:hypothetical protein [Burkholderia phage FLC9]
MSLYQNSSDDLALMISAASGVTVTSSQFTVQGLKPTTAAEKAGVASGKNTKISVLMNPGAPLRGSMTLYYDRLDLGAWSNFSPVLITAAPSNDVSTVLNTIRDQYGFTLTMADIADAQTFTASDGNTHVVLTALSTSLGYTGTFECIMAPLPNISNLFYSSVLSGF